MENTPPNFTLTAGAWYGMEYLFSNGGRHYSPIWISDITPLKTGRGALRVRFYHANYSEGVRDKEYDLTVVHRAEVFLLGVRIDEEGTSMAPVILQAISQDWLRQHFAWIVADMRPGDVLAELVDGKTGRRGIEQPL